MQETFQPRAHVARTRETSLAGNPRSDRDGQSIKALDRCKSIEIGGVVTDEDWRAPGKRLFLHEGLDSGRLVMLDRFDLDDMVAIEQFERRPRNGHEARETQPDIAIIDYSMPGLNGLDLTHALKSELPRLEIMIYTMHEREELIMSVLRAGARAFVLKSDSDQHLFAALDALSIRRPYFSGSVSETLLEQFLRSKDEPSSTALSHREREVVQLISEGKINKQVAEILNISIKTVETHRSAAMHKLKLRTTADLVRYAVRNNIVQP